MKLHSAQVTSILVGLGAVGLSVVRGAGPAGANDVHFPTRILPILTKAGCNSGACHGAATGQGGFKLSLLGYDPRADYESITREFEGRRISLAAPDESLILLKPMRAMPHRGGRRIRTGSTAHETLRRWLEAGAPYGDSTRHIRRIEVTPVDVLVDGPGATRQVRVVAHDSDGHAEDVTALALYDSNDEGIATVDAAGRVTVHRRGLATLMIRYLGQVAAVRIAAPLQDAPIDLRDESRDNIVDRHVLPQLERLRIPPSPLSSDGEFLRRVHLDLTGTLPTPEKVRQFLAAPAGAQGRRKLVDQLLASEAFVDLWTLRWADLLLINSKRMGPEPARAYHAWLRRQVADNRPLNAIVNELLTAMGDVINVPAANFLKGINDPRDMSEFVSRTWLGVRVQCARCHNHPFDRWTQDDYYGQAAFFTRVRFDGGRLVTARHGELEHPRTGKPVAARLLTGATPTRNESGADRRAVLAEWLTGRTNRMFARASVNRIWGHLLGRGIVEPVDDIRVSNPPSNPALLEALADEFVAHDYDVRYLIRTIVCSNTYQRTSGTNAVNRRDTRFFSHAYLKPLTAQVLADVLAQATGVPDRFADQAAGTRAVQLTDPLIESYTLDVLGRCRRQVTCQTMASGGGGLSRTLHLINGSAVNGKLHGGLIESLLADDATDDTVIEELYLRTVSRFPDDRERRMGHRALAAADDRRACVEDLLWALLNAREFAFNH